MKHLLVAAAIAGITLLGFFVFPGHTWLQSDTQIYAPMFEHMWDASVLQKDLIPSRPHLKWTIYDETALGLRRVTGLGFREVLTLEQILFRALAIWGIYLIGRRFTESPAVALMVAGIFSLGATVVGPAVLTVEYEPVPRGFAVALLLCAIGLAVHGEIVWSAVAASVALLYHAPTTFPFWILFAIVVVHARQWTAFIPVALAIVVLGWVGVLQHGASQPLFARIDPALEQLQRMRASYNWVSLWPTEFYRFYAITLAIALAALVRLRERIDFVGRVFFAGLPLIGIVSLPVSYLLLERAKWTLIPQFQPARAVLFILVCTIVLTCLAGARASHAGRYCEAVAWFLAPFWIAVQTGEGPAWPLTFGLAALTVLAVALEGRRQAWGSVAAVLVIVAAAFAIPAIGRVRNYPVLHTAALDDVSRWARTSTPKDAVFLFPAVGKSLVPGIFRAQSLRAVYVDWKTGGQVNYFKDLADEWWSRWQAVMVRHEVPAAVDYLVFDPRQTPSGFMPVYQNSQFVVAAAADFRKR